MIDIQTIASGSSGNAYRITDGYTPLLLECGIPWRKLQVALRFKTSELAACLVTHSHQDHCRAISDVLRSGIDVYCSQGTAETAGVSGHRLYHADAGKQFVIGSWTVLPFEAVHDAPDPLSYLLQNSSGDKLVFITDSSYCPYRFTGITHLLVECNFSQPILDRNVGAGIVEQSRRKRLMESHFSLERVKEFLLANDLIKLQAIYLMHLSNDNSDEALFKREIQSITGVPVTVC